MHAGQQHSPRTLGGEANNRHKKMQCVARCGDSIQSGYYNGRSALWPSCDPECNATGGKQSAGATDRYQPQAAAVLIISSLNFMPNYTVPYRHFLCSLQKCGKWKIRFYCHEDHQNYIHSIVSMSKFANGNNFPNSPFPSAPLPFP